MIVVETAVIESIERIREIVAAAHREGKSVGFVPTLGYLHDGHMRLIDTARKENDLVIASIFVNPLQFGPSEDFESYPRNLAADVEKLSAHACDIVFAPSTATMYPRPIEAYVELPELSRQLCGQSRPTHFQGVATVVSKLFHIVQPDRAYFGQKDGQQVLIIKRMVSDLNMPVEIVTVPTVREHDGLALSSRNVYLTPSDRAHATVLYRALTWAKAQMVAGNRDGIEIAAGMERMIEQETGVRLDYAQIVHIDDLSAVQIAEGNIMLAIAAFVGKARLIDNFQLYVGADEVRDLY